MKKVMMLMLMLIFCSCFTLAYSTEIIDGVSVTPCPIARCVIVETNNVTYRVYPCGKLDRLKWVELNPNEDVTSNFTSNSGSIINIGAELNSTYGIDNIYITEDIANERTR